MYLGEVTWPDVGEYVESESIAIVPLGSTEQHGPALPLGTDHLIAEALARAAAEATGYLCTPTVTIGVSAHHKQFHGTMWVDPDAFRAFVESFSRNLAYHGIDRIVYVNAHGGNVEPLREVGRRLHDDGVAFATEWMWDRDLRELIAELFTQPGPHAGPKETSMIMCVTDGLARPELLEAARDGGCVDWTTVGRQFGSRTFYDAIDNSPNGAFGDQTDASVEAGERLFDAALENLVGLLEWLDAQALSDLLSKPHVESRPTGEYGEVER